MGRKLNTGRQFGEALAREDIVVFAFPQQILDHALGMMVGMKGVIVVPVILIQRAVIQRLRVLRQERSDSLHIVFASPTPGASEHQGGGTGLMGGGGRFVHIIAIEARGCMQGLKQLFLSNGIRQAVHFSHLGSPVLGGSHHIRGNRRRFQTDGGQMVELTELGEVVVESLLNGILVLFFEMLFQLRSLIILAPTSGTNQVTELHVFEQLVGRTQHLVAMITWQEIIARVVLSGVNP